jgi:hypothetical protein
MGNQQRTAGAATPVHACAATGCPGRTRYSFCRACEAYVPEAYRAKLRRLHSPSIGPKAQSAAYQIALRDARTAVDRARARAERMAKPQVELPLVGGGVG